MDQAVLQIDQEIDQLLSNCFSDGLLNDQFTYLMQLQVHDTPYLILLAVPVIQRHLLSTENITQEGI